MSNPARRLLEIYTAWGNSYEPNKQVLQSRGLSDNDPTAIATQLEAFKLLISIEHAMDYLAQKNPNIDEYRKHFPEWVKMAIHAPGNWQGGSDFETSFPSTHLSHLGTFAILLDFDQPALQPEPEAKLRDLVQSVIDLLLIDESLSPHLREYIFKLANELRTALDDESVTGTFDFPRAAERLWVGLYAAAGQSKNMRSKWRSIATGIFRDAGTAALGSLPSIGITIAQISASSGS
jgi:hypothetical protein